MFWISKVIWVVTRFPQWWWVLVSISFFSLWWWVFPALSKVFLLWSSSNSTLCWLQRKLQKAYSTWYSQAVSHPSTNQARPCLASEIGRDRACSGWYGRKRRTPATIPYLYMWTTTIIHTIVALWPLKLGFYFDFMSRKKKLKGQICHNIAGTKSFWFSVISFRDNVQVSYTVSCLMVSVTPSQAQSDSKCFLYGSLLKFLFSIKRWKLGYTVTKTYTVSWQTQY